MGMIEDFKGKMNISLSMDNFCAASEQKSDKQV